MNSRRWNSRPDGPNEGQKFADDLAQEMGASQYAAVIQRPVYVEVVDYLFVASIREIEDDEAFENFGLALSHIFRFVSSRSIDWHL